jgi:acyl carrier protein
VTDDEARKLLVQAMRYAGITSLAVKQREAFEAGTADIELDQLEMDSLATMELCIAIEANSGLSITPDQLQEARTGNELVRRIIRGGQ